jgi:hypothetical protein
MMLDPRLVEIPQSLLDLVGENLARNRLILPLRDDGICITLFCPSHPQYGTYGESIASRIGTILDRKIEWVPVDRDIIAQAVDERFAVIDNCPIEFSLECPKTWHSLDTTEDEKVRFCPACQSNVYWCDRVSDAKALAKEGKCVAISGNDDADDTNTSATLGMLAT